MKFAEIESPSGRWLIFASYNAGLLLLGVYALSSRLLPTTIGATLTALGAVAYSLFTLRTLSFAYRR
jgi:high-affinity K+ transport system ATPase subunit B